MPGGRTVFGLPGSSAELRFIFREIFIQRLYTRHGIEIHDGDCILDVGANVGLFTSFAIERARGLKIIAFEPVPPIFAALQANVDAVATPRAQRGHEVKLFSHGLSDREQEVEITFYPSVPGNSTLYPEAKPSEARAAAAAFRLRDVWKLDKLACLAMLLVFPFRRTLVRGMLEQRFRQGQRLNIHVRRLSDVLEEIDIQRIDLLKVDVEGAEFDVLAGLSDGDWGRIQQLVMEVAPANTEHLSALVRELSGRGFEFVTVETFGSEVSKSFGEQNKDVAALPQTLYARRG